MSTIQNVIYILDSRLRESGSTINNATYNLIPSGGLLAGTYEMLSFHTLNDVFNVETGVNNQIVWDEFGTADNSALITAGYYSATALATHVASVMSAASGDGNTYTVVYSATTGKYTFDDGAGSTWNFTWLTKSATETNLANEILGFSLVDTLPVDNTQISDNQVDLSLHSSIIIDIPEDSQQNVHLLDGSEHSLIVPLVGDYQAEINTLKDQVYSQNIVFSTTLNNIAVNLFTEDGAALLNSAEYELTIRRIF